MNVIPHSPPSFLFCGYEKGVRRWDGPFRKTRFPLGSFFARAAAATSYPLSNSTPRPSPTPNLQPPLSYYWLVSREDVIIRAASLRWVSPRGWLTAWKTSTEQNMPHVSTPLDAIALSNYSLKITCRCFLSSLITIARLNIP